MSRRRFGKVALTAGLASVAGAAAAVPAAQSGEVEELEKQLATPFSPESKPLVGGALKAVRDASKERMKHALPENSEPCTRYVPSTEEAR
ncbi:MAG: hypothetical protein M9921_00855 [Fimbriimonadaceae bacterium]|nr:hypothetical protein [Chthonomonadaceae bacterium]MCO5295384.1 hypothetical protein [Fimbriimonadaceae bacterium]